MWGLISFGVEKKANQNMKIQKYLFFKPAGWEGDTDQESTSVERKNLGSTAYHEPNTTGLCRAVEVKQA